MTPRRIRLSRQRGWRKPPNTVVVTRPSMWGNPFKIKAEDPEHPGKSLDRARAVALYRDVVERAGDQFRARAVAELGGRNLGCWCPLDEPCHADVLLDLANPA